MEKYLRDNGIFGRDYIRPMMSSAKRERGLSKYREIPFSALSDKGKDGLGIPESYR